jgi:hypothetical protein
MSQLVKNKRQANFKDFKRFGALKGLVEQKNVVFNYYLQSLTLQSFIDTLYMLVHTYDYTRNLCCVNFNEFYIVI